MGENFPWNIGHSLRITRLERLKVSTASALGVPLVRANIESWQPPPGISIVSFSNKNMHRVSMLYFKVVAKTLDHLEKKIYSALSWSLGGKYRARWNWAFIVISVPQLLSSSLLTFVDTFLSHHMSKRPAIPGITLNSPTHKVKVWCSCWFRVHFPSFKRAMSLF